MMMPPATDGQPETFYEDDAYDNSIPDVQVSFHIYFYPELTTGFFKENHQEEQYAAGLGKSENYESERTGLGKRPTSECDCFEIVVIQLRSVHLLQASPRRMFHLPANRR